ncbi:GMC family oxidoreductase [Polaribacter sp. ALD11]|uniref:GMC oxidoreductase n=1 Tax=Polaribacter sp. ALD11 TaxID=2058137 RepID=UPI000C30AC07|nr:GMC family oxidoreductase [Polaribacter sp. ALD11]AUC86173.1 GMC family oxidoreductase [Polaribacter sp. ALD11]
MSNNKDSFDAIVIGTGISGGWAAKELCEAGLKTLVLERGRNIEHIKDYKTANKETWELEFRGKPSNEDFKKQGKQSRTGFVTNQAYKHWFVNDLKHPYNETKRFDWVRGYHVGGRSLTWGRQTLRLSDLDFTANKKENIAVDWPIRYKDIEPWYTHVEKFIGVSGESLNLPQLPDGHFTPPMLLNCVEKEFKNKIGEIYENRYLTMGRFANITGKNIYKNRHTCVHRNKCMRGCPLGGYFSSNASTLPAANETGNMTLRPNSIAYEIIYDDAKKQATGVKIIDTITKEKQIFYAKIIFCCASTIASTSILMQSKSGRFPNGLGNDSGELGHNLMDHHFRVGASAIYNGFKDINFENNRPTSFHIVRFQNLGDKKSEKKYTRGYSFQGSASRKDWQHNIKELSFGLDLKEKLKQQGPWRIGITGFGECLPYHENKMELDYNKKDEWGLPTITFDCEFKENEKLMRADMKAEAIAMLTKTGFTDVKGFEDSFVPGHAIHEMGTARMGHDSKTAVLNKNNQIHNVPNVYVTDGACMTSSGNQNPSLTYMALTARAAHHAIKMLKKQNT